MLIDCLNKTQQTIAKYIFSLLAILLSCNSFASDENQLVSKLSTESIKYSMVSTEEEQAKAPRHFFDFETSDIKTISQGQLDKILSQYQTKPSSWPQIINFNPLKVFYVNENAIVFFDSDNKVSQKEVISTEDRYVAGYIGHNEDIISVYSYREPHIQTYSFKDMTKTTYDFSPSEFTSPYNGIVLSKRNKLAFSELDKTGLFTYDFKTKQISEIDTEISYFINRPFIESITTDKENRYLFFAVKKGSRINPSKWVGFFVYDLEMEKMIYKDKIYTNGGFLKNISLSHLSNNIIGLRYTNQNKQLDWFIKYKYKY